MAEDVIFEPDGASIANLESLAHNMLTLEERRICELYEIARKFVSLTAELLAVGMTLCEVLSLLSESETVPSSHSVHSTAMENNLLRLAAHAKIMSSSDRAIFCSLLYELFAESGALISENMFLPTEKLPQTFTYVKNSFADEAYDVFSQEFSDPRVVYAKSFKEALALVADGTVSYCLLPIEERGARLSTVSELLFKGDFKIASVTPVLGFDGLADMKYALVSRSFALSAYDHDDDRYFELRLPKSAKTSLGDFLLAAEHYGLHLYKLNTMRFDTEEGDREYFSIILHASGADFTEMLIYLTLFADEFVPVGVYKNIE